MSSFILNICISDSFVCILTFSCISDTSVVCISTVLNFFVCTSGSLIVFVFISGNFCSGSTVCIFPVFDCILSSLVSVRIVSVCISTL
eukprot:02969.XXX_106454_106717_1 [CDS] Oithona nana genome sequencing.